MEILNGQTVTEVGAYYVRIAGTPNWFYHDVKNIEEHRKSAHAAASFEFVKIPTVDQMIANEGKLAALESLVSAMQVKVTNSHSAVNKATEAIQKVEEQFKYLHPNGRHFSLWRAVCIWAKGFPMFFLEVFTGGLFSKFKKK